MLAVANSQPTTISHIHGVFQKIKYLYFGSGKTDVNVLHQLFQIICNQIQAQKGLPNIRVHVSEYVLI